MSNSPSNEQLKPCPFCGSTSAATVEDAAGQWTVQCAGCLARGPRRSNVEGIAALDWNGRLAQEAEIEQQRDLLARAAAYGERLRAALKAHDGWLARTGHGADHPWRTSIARTLAGSPVEATAPRWHRETGWLVEIMTETGPQWLQLLQSGHEDWTATAINATRFARKEDAETVIGHRNIVDGVATDHAWEGPAVEPTGEQK